MKIIDILHKLSYLRWFFLVWMVSLMFYVFIGQPENPQIIVGKIIYLSGIMMCFASLSDTTKITDKQKRDLSNPKIVKRLFIIYFAAVILVVLISVLFLTQRYIYLEADKTILNDFTKLGYDCLVMMLGMLCLIKQLADQVNYINSTKSN